MLAPGTRLGPYEIRSALGAGGMGEVYRARDTRLERSVAIKVLPQDRAASAEMRARFEREARAISALSHPHICALFDIGSEQDTDFLVMELIEGETLAARLERGPLPLADTLRIGAEIAEALGYAHRKSIVHRDLKPGNVMLTKAGAKLLDFGLAKPQRSPTPEALPLTEEGLAVGTPQYMAPEALRGHELDARADVFALGALLYEMATGRRAFAATTQADAIALILASEPARAAALATLAPPELDRLVRRCLEADPEQRWQDAGDLAIELRWLAAGPASVSLPVARGRGGVLVWVALLVLAGAGLGWLARGRAGPAREARSARLALVRPANAPYIYCDEAVLSRDSTQVAFVGFQKDGRPQLYVRALDGSEARLLPGTEDAHMPFWSPNGRSLGYFSEDKLKRVDLAGGARRTLCAARHFGGGTWGPDERIVFHAGDKAGLASVSAQGGNPELLTRIDAREEAHLWPQFLPDGKHVLFLGDAQAAEDHHLRVVELASGRITDICQAISNAAVGAGDELYFVRSGKLLAQSLDPRSFQLLGEPREVAHDLTVCWGNHRFEFAVSHTGALVYRSQARVSQFHWYDRAGKHLASVGEPHNYGEFDLSPDGRQLVYGLMDEDDRDADLWLMELDSGRSERFTFDQLGNQEPRFSPDGSSVAFATVRKTPISICRRGVGDAAPPEVLLSPDHYARVSSWYPDGKHLLLKLRNHLAALSLADGSVESVLETEFGEFNGQVSPDGRSLAYVSEESGHEEVYLRRLPIRTGRLSISSGVSRDPRWRLDGKELFFRDLVGEVVLAVPVDGADELRGGVPVELFRVPGLEDYAPAPDGQRFLLRVSVEDPMAVPLTVLLEFAATR